MSKIRVLSFCLLSLFLCGCEKQVSVPCQKTGFTDKPVCPTSFFQALGSRSYDARVVRISGYLTTTQIAGSSRSFLFFSEDQAKISNYFGAIEIGDFSKNIKPVRREAYKKTFAERQNAYVEIVGELSYTKATGQYKPPAEINNIVGVREVP